MSRATVSACHSSSCHSPRNRTRVETLRAHLVDRSLSQGRGCEGPVTLFGGERQAVRPHDDLVELVLFWFEADAIR